MQANAPLDRIRAALSTRNPQLGATTQRMQAMRTGTAASAAFASTSTSAASSSSSSSSSSSAHYRHHEDGDHMDEYDDSAYVDSTPRELAAAAAAAAASLAPPAHSLTHALSLTAASSYPGLSQPSPFAVAAPSFAAYAALAPKRIKTKVHVAHANPHCCTKNYTRYFHSRVVLTRYFSDCTLLSLRTPSAGRVCDGGRRGQSARLPATGGHVFAHSGCRVCR
jgi:hypothetical protein